MPVLDIDGRALSWREAGHGAPAVLLHCSLAHSGALSGVMAGLSDRLAMRAPDLPGHGGTGLDPRGPNRDQALEDARRMLPATGPAHLIGHSYGATVALRLALADPGRIASLTLIEPVQFSLLAEDDPDAFAAEMAAQAPFLGAAAAGDWPEAARRFLGRWGGVSAGADAQRSAYMLARIPLVAAENLILNDPEHSGVRARDLPRITCPVLLAAGAESPQVAHRILDVIAARLPAASRLTIPGAGHMAPLTHPRPIAAAIAGRVAGVTSPGAPASLPPAGR